MPLTYAQAVHWLQRRGEIFYDGVEANTKFFCSTHNTTHPIGFWSIIIGRYIGFDTEQEVIEWVEALLPNSI